MADRSRSPAASSPSRRPAALLLARRGRRFCVAPAAVASVAGTAPAGWLLGRASRSSRACRWTSGQVRRVGRHAKRVETFARAFPATVGGQSLTASSARNLTVPARSLVLTPLNMNDRLRLVLLSFLMLFVELALIRWAGSNVVYLSYFSNFVLLGSFLGIGLGFLRASRTRPAPATRRSRSAALRRVRPLLPGRDRPQRRESSSSSATCSRSGPPRVAGAARSSSSRSPR